MGNNRIGMELSYEEIRERLRLACKKAGSQKLWAEANGISRPYVSQVLNGLQWPGPRILAALGCRKGQTRRFFEGMADDK